MSPDNYYSTLGIETDATADIIKKAYRRLSLELHPDRTKDNPILTEKYKKVNQAYGVLNDKDRKRIYDLQNIQNIQNIQNMRNMRTNNDFKAENFMDMLNRAGINNTRASNVNSNVFDLNGAMNDILNNKNSIFNSEKFNNMMSKPPPIIKKISITLQEAFTGCKKPIEIERWICANTIKHNEKETLYLLASSG